MNLTPSDMALPSAIHPQALILWFMLMGLLQSLLLIHRLARIHNNRILDPDRLIILLALVLANR